METVIGIVVIIIALILTVVFALCKVSGTKDEVDQQAMEYLKAQAKGHSDLTRELKKKHKEDKK